MTLIELRTFLAIVDSGSLVAASQQLNVTQSTVTARLKSLEEQIGQPLLVRNKSGVSMTAAGVRMQRYADTISDLWRQARQETALPDGKSSICNLACEYDLWQGLGDNFFEQLHLDNPEVGLSVWLGSATDISRWLEEGKSDLALTTGSTTTQRQRQIALQPDTLILVSTQEGGPTKFDPNYVFVEAGTAFARDHAAAYADAGVARTSFGNAALGRDHILAYGGSAYLPMRLAADGIKDGTLHWLSDAPDFERPIYLTYNHAAVSGWSWFADILQSALGVQLAD